MSFEEIAIRARDLSKQYVMFARPEDRLKQMVVPRLQRALGRPPTRYFRDFAALNGLSFDIRRGETVGIIGRNGSGKSTLLQIVCGTLQPTAGSVQVNGRIAALLELGAGFNPEFSGRENAYLNAAILGLSRAEIDERFESISRFADIGDFIDQPVKTYSSGMYVRLAFATAINVDPDILLVDEALAVGDEAFQRKCYARIEQIKERGGTILFVSHSAQTIVQLCDRAMLIDQGELILDGRPKLVTGQYQRLVNASPEMAPGIRRSIIEISQADESSLRTGAGEQSLAPTDTRSTESQTDEVADSDDQGILEAAAEADWEAPEQYDPSLVPQSTIHFEESGARIRDVQIRTLDGRRMNVLRLGRRYRVDFKVDSFEEMRNVNCGLLVRNVHGIRISGVRARYSPFHGLKLVRRGQIISAQFDFTCIFLPGSYFISCMCRATGEDGSLLGHRIFDAAMFRVLPEHGLQAVGSVDASINATISFTAG